MSSSPKDRRRFLKEAALAGLAAGAVRGASAQEAATAKTAQMPDLHAYGERSRFETAARGGTMGDMYPPGGLAPGAKRDFGLRDRCKTPSDSSHPHRFTT